MSDDFKDLLVAIEGEAREEGPEAVAELNAYRARLRIASQIIGLRKARGWSQTDLETQSGIRQPEISRIESGRIAPSQVTLSRLAAPFGYTLALVQDEVDSRELDLA
jgi:ribosome-binding protein aMBF1 (putative translation factor)